jgi:hypothetical protein
LLGQYGTYVSLTERFPEQIMVEGAWHRDSSSAGERDEQSVLSEVMDRTALSRFSAGTD